MRRLLTQPLVRLVAMALLSSGLAIASAPTADAAPRSGKRVAQAKPAKTPVKADKPAPKAAPKPQPKAPSKKPAAKKSGLPKDHTESKKAPRGPKTTPQTPDKDARESIAGEIVKETAADATVLKEIRDVDDTLFFDLEPSQTPAANREAPPVVQATGLPPSTDLQANGGASTNDAASGGGASDVQWMGQLTAPDLPFRWDARLIRYLDYFKNNPKGRAFASSLLKRAGRYEAKIREALKARKMPEDLVYLALVESGMNPRIVSGPGAAGLWQFMPKAAEAYGLRIDKWVDERLDPERSTEAALRFLADLHTRFGRWELAMAAYNMGHGGLLTSIRKYNTNDFWELSELEAGVPYETALYVPKIVALAFVGHNKAVFGLADLVSDPPEKFEVAKVPAGATLESVAAVTGAPKAAIVKANPQIVGDSVPPTQASTVRVPEGTKAAVEQGLAPSDSGTSTTYVLRWGESLEYVAATVGMTESRLRAQNGITDPVPPRPGTKILLPRAPGKIPALDPVVVVVPSRTPEIPDKRRVFYEVVWGDMLDDVAKKLGVLPEDLSRWNNLDRTARLHGKMMLQAFVDKDRAFDDVRLIDAVDAKILVVGSPEFFDHFEAKNNRMRVVVAAKQGDTLRKLAKRYGISVGMLERINHRYRDAEIAEGESVVVYTARTSAAAAVATQEKSDASGEDTIYDGKESSAAAEDDAADQPAPEQAAPATP
ncbi:MAG: transglycosylase SLT domain-containing protein [Polyangiaceae bacterium]